MLDIYLYAINKPKTRLSCKAIEHIKHIALEIQVLAYA